MWNYNGKILKTANIQSVHVTFINPFPLHNDTIKLQNLNITLSTFTEILLQNVTHSA